MKNEVSSVVPTAFSSGAQKLGQPVPLSNFVVEEKRSRSQPAQAKLPRRSSCSRGLVNARSVALSRSTAYWSGVSSLRHSSSLWVTSNVPAARGAAPHQGELAAAARAATPPVKRRRLVIIVQISR